MNKVSVFIKNNQKAVKIPSGIRLLVRRCCNAVLRLEQFEHSAEISITFVDNDQIRKLNSEYRGKDTATDVLSFPLFEKGRITPDASTGVCALGDVVISLERAVSQADTFGHTLQREVAFLTVHSVLHLLGYDHENDKIGALHMREKEEQVLSQIGVGRGASYVLEE